MDECLHINVRNIGDMPIAEPITYEFLGRFDVTQCIECLEILSQTPTIHPPPEEHRPGF